MDVRGLQKFTLVDYPGRIGCVIFTGSCNFRCPFCHNPCLVFDPGSQPRVTDKEFFGFLDSRRGLLQGVVISGGEPTLQPDLEEYIRRIREMGFEVKLDSNGSHPEVVERLCRTCGLDAMGIDYKAPAAAYGRLTGVADPACPQMVRRTIRFCVAEKIALDVRTTVHRELLSPADLATMAGELRDCGVKCWTLQQFNPVEVIDDDLPSLPTYSDHELQTLASQLSTGDLTVRLRGLTGRILG